MEELEDDSWNFEKREPEDARRDDARAVTTGTTNGED